MAQLDVGRLRLLREVALRGSIAGAAREVGLSASAVSQHLSALERETGVALIDRSSRGVHLTGAGQALVERARLIDELLEQAGAELEQQLGVAAGPIKLGAVASAAVSLVSETALALAVECPGLTLSVLVAEPSASIAALVAGDLDIAVVDVYDGVPLALPDYLSATELLVEPLMVVSKPERAAQSAASKSAAKPSVTLAQLRDARWVMPPATAACGTAVRFACRAAGFEPDVRWETDDMLLLAKAIAAGHGIAVLPKLVIADSAVELDLAILREPRLQRRLIALTRSSAAARVAVAAVLSALTKAGSNRSAATT